MKKLTTILLSLSLAAAMTTTAFAGTWEQAADGRWKYIHNDGRYMHSDWEEINGVNYYFDADGYMLANGWLTTDDGSSYYFDENGQKASGWHLYEGFWYYTDSSGKMLTGWVDVNGERYHLKDNGQMDIGWVEDGGSWYYMDPTSGALVKNTTTPDGYVVNADGVWTGESVTPTLEPSDLADGTYHTVKNPLSDPDNKGYYVSLNVYGNKMLLTGSMSKDGDTLSAPSELCESRAYVLVLSDDIVYKSKGLHDSTDSLTQEEFLAAAANQSGSSYDNLLPLSFTIKDGKVVKMYLGQ